MNIEQIGALAGALLSMSMLVVFVHQKFIAPLIKEIVQIRTVVQRELSSNGGTSLKDDIAEIRREIYLVKETVDRQDNDLLARVVANEKSTQENHKILLALIKKRG